MMVIYLPVKSEFNLTNRFQVKSVETEILMDRQTKNRQTNGQNYINFERNLATIVIYFPVKFEFNWTNCF